MNRTARPTLPPSTGEAAALAAFEQQVREQGEQDARLAHTRRVTPVPSKETTHGNDER